MNNRVFLDADIASSRDRSKNLLYPKVFGLVFAWVFFAFSAKAQFAGGDGSPEDPYQISTAEQLAAIPKNEAKACYILTDDIDLDVAPYNVDPGWAPINYFEGVFDGDGYVIKGLYVRGNGGLFAMVPGTVRNLGIVDATVIGSGANIGGFAGALTGGSISNCYFTGSVSSNDGYMGGFVGQVYADCAITDCYVSANVTCNVVNAGRPAGGFAGNVNGTLTNCYSTGTMVSSGEVTGGFAGNVNAGATCVNCYSASDVEGKNFAGRIVGGFVGRVLAGGTVKNCAALNPAVKGAATNTGRVAGNNAGTLSNNYAFEGMLNIDGTTLWTPLGELGNINGMDASIEDVHAAAFFEEDVFDGDLTAWTFADGKLPGLFGQSLDMLNHLKEKTFSLSEDAGSLYLFAFKEPGYSEAPKLSVTISNNSFEAISFTMSLGGENADDFELSASTIASIAAGASDDFTVNPTVGLPYGNYTATLKVTDNNSGFYIDFDVLFIVADEGKSGIPDVSWYKPEEDTYSISSPDQLAGFAQLLVGGNNFSGKTVNLDDNIDISIYDWSTRGVGTLFAGTFEGNEHTISGLTINAPTASVVGLFGTVTGDINALGVIGADIRASQNVGIIAGHCSGNLTGCYSTGNIVATSLVGGLIGQLLPGGSLTDCYSEANITANGSNVGGLLGFSGNAGSESNYCFITGCYASGELKISGGATGDVVGGFAGRILFTEITNCYATGNVSSTTVVVGGFVGRCDAISIIQNSFATGDVTSTGVGDEGSSFVGGFVGLANPIDANNCYATGNVKGSYNVGGFVGRLAINGGKVKNCYALGEVSGSNNVGGLAGYSMAGFTAPLSNSAALNPAVKCPNNATAGRVVGKSEGILSDNVAFAGMLNNAGGTWENGTSDDKNGEPVGETDINADGFFQNVFDGVISAWTFAEGKLPGFGAALDMPNYLRVKSFSLSGVTAGDVFTFPTEDVGYEETAPLTVTVSNNSAGNISVAIALSGANADDFELSAASFASIAAGADADFSVNPVTGLDEGIYVATVTITDNFDVYQSFVINFTVVKSDKPIFVRSGTTTDPTTMKTITWMTDPTADPQAKMKVAKKSEGMGGFVEFSGETMDYIYNTNLGTTGNPDIPKRAYQVTATGLDPDTEYIYQVGDGTSWSDVKEFTTVSATTDKFTFYVLPDLQASNANTPFVKGSSDWLNRIAGTYSTTNPLFTIQVGDLVDREHVYNYYKLFGDVCDNNQEFANTDMVFAMGNHEYYYGFGTNPNAGGHADPLPEGRGDISKFLNGTPVVCDRIEGTGTYSVNYGNVHVIVLDLVIRDVHPLGGTVINPVSTTDAINAQAEWLRNDLENCDKPWKIVSVHYPVYYHGSDYDDPISAMTQKLGPIFDEFGVNAVFSGHVHTTRRTQVKNGNGVPANGAEGTGLTAGGSQITTVANGTSYITCGNLSDATDASVYIKGEVDGETMTLTMIQHNGPVRDLLTIVHVVAVKSINVTGAEGKTEITEDGVTLQMQATILPEDATDATVAWSVINGTGRASINADGLLKPLADGDVTVRATAKDGSGVYGEMVITLSGQVDRGDGSPENPYQIATAAQLAEIPKDGATDCYILIADIDLDIAPYNEDSGWAFINNFRGVLDGDGHVINGLYINGGSTAGLFGLVYGTVKNLGVVDGSVTAVGPNAAGFVGALMQGGSISNCYFTGSITTTDGHMGAFAGQALGDFTNCYASANVTCTVVGGGRPVGGFAGNVSGTLTNCYSTGTVFSTGELTGGFAGVVNAGASCVNCYTTSDVEGNNFNGRYVGGFAGRVLAGGTVKNCAALNPAVKGAETNTGRVVGANAGTLSNNYAFAGILNIDDAIVWEPTGTLDNINGMRASAADISTADFFEENVFDGDLTAWTFADGKLPGFGSAVDMPEHLKIGPVEELTGTPTISNTAPRIGDALTGSLEGGNNTGALTFVWKCNDVQAGTGESYTVAVADLGKTITLEITSDVETGTLSSAPTAAVLKKAAPDAPAPPTLVSKTHNSVTLTANDSYLFSMDGENWQESGEFTGLTANTTYSFYQRIAETDDTEASAASAKLDVTTDNDITGVEDLKANPLKAWIQDGILNIDGIAEGKLWKLYSISGALVKQGIADNDTVTVPLPNVGMYIIQSEENTLTVVVH